MKRFLFLLLPLLVFLAGCAMNNAKPVSATDLPAGKTSGLQEIGILAKGME